MMILQAVNKSQPLRGDIIKFALGKLDALGQTFMMLVKNNLKFSGINLNHKNYYSLEEMGKVLDDTFGPKITPMIIASLESSLLKRKHLQSH